MRKPGGQFKRSYSERIALVRRYLETDEIADDLATEAGVRVSTFRRWVRTLRPEIEAGGLNDPMPDEVKGAVADSEEGRLSLTQAS